MWGRQRARWTLEGRVRPPPLTDRRPADVDPWHSVPASEKGRQAFGTPTLKASEKGVESGEQFLLLDCKAKA